MYFSFALFKKRARILQEIIFSEVIMKKILKLAAVLVALFAMANFVSCSDGSSSSSSGGGYW